eukprot:4726058-Amphidinium_carterae.1
MSMQDEVLGYGINGLKRVATPAPDPNAPQPAVDITYLDEETACKTQAVSVRCGALGMLAGLSLSLAQRREHLAVFALLLLKDLRLTRGGDASIFVLVKAD